MGVPCIPFPRAAQRLQLALRSASQFIFCIVVAFIVLVNWAALVEKADGHGMSLCHTARIQALSLVDMMISESVQVNTISCSILADLVVQTWWFRVVKVPSAAR